jgi:hypothetical protein
VTPDEYADRVIEEAEFTELTRPRSLFDRFTDEQGRPLESPPLSLEMMLNAMPEDWSNAYRVKHNLRPNG